MSEVLGKILVLDDLLEGRYLVIRHLHSTVVAPPTIISSLIILHQPCFARREHRHFLQTDSATLDMPFR